MRAQSLWEQLQHAGIASGELPAIADMHSPWYIRLLVGFSGWFAAFFLLSFFGVAFAFVFDYAGVALVMGIGLLAFAYFILRMGKNEFASQFCLAISYTGQALVIYGLFKELNHQETLVWLLIMLFQMLLAVLFDHVIHRAGSAWAAALAFAVYLSLHGWHYLAVGTIAIITALVLLHELTWPRWSAAMNAAGYGLGLGLVTLECTNIFGYSLLSEFGEQPGIAAGFQPRLAEIVTALVLFGVVWRLLSRAPAQLPARQKLLALAATALLGLVSLKAPGIATGIMLVLLAYSNGDRLLLGLGILSLLAYVFMYYYLLETTLLVKSVALIATGVVLLGVRFAAVKWVFLREETEHA